MLKVKGKGSDTDISSNSLYVCWFQQKSYHLHALHLMVELCSAISNLLTLGKGIKPPPRFEAAECESGASPAGGQGRHCPPPPPPPPDLFLALPRYFFGRKKLLFLAGKTV